jgi:hypothetical protein
MSTARNPDSPRLSVRECTSVNTTQQCIKCIVHPLNTSWNDGELAKCLWRKNRSILASRLKVSYAKHDVWVPGSVDLPISQEPDLAVSLVRLSIFFVALSEDSGSHCVLQDHSIISRPESRPTMLRCIISELPCITSYVRPT